MSIRRTLSNILGRIQRNAVDSFWAITTTSHDPVIPSLPLETPSGGGTTEYGAATMSGVGTISGAALRIRTTTGTVAGTGAVASVATRIRTAAGAMAGSGSLAALGDILGGVVEYGIAAFTGNGSLGGLAVRVRIATATATGAGALAGVAIRIRLGLAAISGAGSLSTIGDYLYSGIFKSWNGSTWTKRTLTTWSDGSQQAKPLRTWTGSILGRVDTTGG